MGTGPYIIEKTLPNENYIVRRLNTNKTQILHRIRLKKLVPNQPLEDSYQREKFQPNDEIVIPQDDLYTITWETDFGTPFLTRDNETVPPTNAIGNETITSADYPKTTLDIEVRYGEQTDTPNDVTETTPSTDDALNNDVTTETTNATPRANQNIDLPDPAICPEMKKNKLPDSSKNPKNADLLHDQNSDTGNDACTSSNTGDDIIVPEISQNDNELENKSPRRGKYNLRPNPNPNYSEDFRY